MEGTQYVTRESILQRAQEIKGIPLRDVDKTGRLATGKGAIGTVIEESWFGYTPNSESEPDFPEAGVELKVTPYLRGKNGIRAKVNSTPFVRQYDILSKKWGVFLCQRGYRTNGIRRNSRSWSWKL